MVKEVFYCGSKFLYNDKKKKEEIGGFGMLIFFLRIFYVRRFFMRIYLLIFWLIFNSFEDLGLSI